MKKSALICLLFSFFIIVSTFAEIRRVEPSFWWAGMNNPSLQLLIHGDGVGEASVSIDSDQVKLSALKRVENSNFLFPYFDLSGVKGPHTFTITLRQDDEVIDTIEYQLKQRRRGADEIKGFDNGDVIYLITPDRFANGDPSNDSISGMRETAVDRNEPYGRHGGDLQGIIDRLDYLEQLGVTAIWLNPVLENDMAKPINNAVCISRPESNGRPV